MASTDTLNYRRVSATFQLQYSYALNQFSRFVSTQLFRVGMCQQRVKKMVNMFLSDLFGKTKTFGVIAFLAARAMNNCTNPLEPCQYAYRFGIEVDTLW